MAASLSEFSKQLGGFWQSLPTVKRLALVLVTGAVLVAVAAVAVLGTRVHYAYLYTNLETRDAAEIAQKLSELKVPHQVDSGGTAIKVPEERVHALRLELANAGLPKGGGVGNELFDQSHLGATEFEQNVNLRRALEGELARSITTLNGVDSARVHLVLPKQRLFAAKSEAASASVVLRLRNRHDFGRRETAGIVHLVTTAVPNLTSDRVTIVDANGVVLHRPDASNSGLSALGDGARDGMHDAETAIENRVRTLLERTVGPGAVDVRVKLELDPATRERTEEHYEPTRTALRSEHKTEERMGVEGASVAGVPGAQTNLPDVEPSVAPSAAEDSGNVARRSQTRNWEIDRVVEKVLMPAGEVRRISVAVLVDGQYETREGQSVYVPRSPDDLQALRSIVKGAVGLNEQRGDALELHEARFVRPEAEKMAEPVLRPELRRYAPHAVAGIAVLFLLLTVLVWRGKRVKQVRELEHARLQAAAFAEEQLRLADEARLLEEETGSMEPLDAQLAARRRSEALEIATTDPATAAIVLREWLHLDAPKLARVREG